MKTRERQRWPQKQWEPPRHLTSCNPNKTLQLCPPPFFFLFFSPFWFLFRQSQYDQMRKATWLQKNGGSYWACRGFNGLQSFCVLRFFPPFILNFNFLGLFPRRVFPQEATLHISLLDLLYFMWLLTSCPAARADMRESSPARTEPAIMVAKSLEFAPGDSRLAPFTPSRFRQAD